MKRTFQPHNRRRKKVHGFRERDEHPGQRIAVLKRRRDRSLSQLPYGLARLPRAASSMSAAVPPRDRRLTLGGDSAKCIDRAKAVPRRFHDLDQSGPSGRSRPRGATSRAGKVGHAVKRNRAKRLLREASVRPCSPARPSDLADLDRPGLLPPPGYSRVSDEMNRLWPGSRDDRSRIGSPVPGSAWDRCSPFWFGSIAGRSRRFCRGLAASSRAALPTPKRRSNRQLRLPALT